MEIQIRIPCPHIKCERGIILGTKNEVCPICKGRHYIKKWITLDELKEEMK